MTENESEAADDEQEAEEAEPEADWFKELSSGATGGGDKDTASMSSKQSTSASDAAATSAHCPAHRDFTCPGRGARQQHVRDVGAGDEDDE